MNAAAIRAVYNLTPVLPRSLSSLAPTVDRGVPLGQAGPALAAQPFIIRWMSETGLTALPTAAYRVVLAMAAIGAASD
jgi:hypothetical protein